MHTQELKCLFYITYLILELELMFDPQPYILHTAAEERMEGFTLWLSLSYLTGASHAVRGCPTLAFSSLQLFQRGSCGSYEGQENKSNGTRCISICSLNVNPEFENAPLPKDLRYTFIHYTLYSFIQYLCSETLEYVNNCYCIFWSLCENCSSSSVFPLVSSADVSRFWSQLTFTGDAKWPVLH